MVNKKPNMIHLYQDRMGDWRWKVRAGNNRTISSSGEAFSDRHAAITAAQNANPGLAVETEMHKDK